MSLTSFRNFNTLGSQVTVQNQFDRFLYDGVLKDLKGVNTLGCSTRKQKARFATTVVVDRKRQLFRKLTGKHTSQVVSRTDDFTSVEGEQALRIEHPQLATALAIQQTLIMAGQVTDDVATIIALSTIGAGRPALTEATLLQATAENA